MAVDYDLVVIGATPAGIYAAVTAAQLKVRVALVTQQVMPLTSVVGHRPVLELARTVRQVKRAQQLGVVHDVALPTQSDLSQQVANWSIATTRALSDRYSLASTAAQGVEIVDGSGAFYRKPILGFEVAGRSLRSRRYLLALPSQPTIPQIQGLSEVGYLIVDQLLQKLPLLPSQARLILIGANSTAAELAQALNILGFQIVLIVPGDRLLPQLDPEAVQLVQAQLEAEGVQIMTHAAINQVQQLNHKKRVGVGAITLEVDEIVLAMGQTSQTAGLNLEAADVHLQNGAIALDLRLRTTNPKVYACTNLSFLAGDSDPCLERRYAELAVQNALFAPFASKLHQALLPSGIVATEPTCAWVGMTEASARKRYGKNVVVLRQWFKAITQAQLRGETTGLCKLVLRQNGEIVGAAVVGAEAQEWIGALALAMQQTIPLQKLAQLPLPTPSFAEILHQAAQAWKQQRLTENEPLQDLLTAWFNWRRGRVG